MYEDSQRLIRRSRVLDADGLLAALLLTILSTSGLYYLIILPVFVVQLQALFGLSPALSGVLVSVDGYAGVGSALLISIFIHKLRWKPLLAGALVVIATCEALTPLAGNLPELFAVRVLHGLASGTATALTASVIGRTRLPDKVYGVLLVYQAAISAGALFALPHFLSAHGPWLTFEITAAATAAALLLIPVIPDFASPNGNVRQTRAVRGLRPEVLAAVAAVYVFQVFHTSLNAYTLGIGDALGLEKVAAANGVGLGQSVGVLGALIVIVIGMRFGRVLPLSVTIPVALLEGALLLLGKHSEPNWVTAQILDGALTYYALPLLLGTCAATDPGGRAPIWGGLASKLGLATGPALGGFLIETSYRGLIAGGAAGMALAGAVAIYAAARLAHAHRDPPR